MTINNDVLKSLFNYELTSILIEFQVTATDGDKDRDHNIVYFLTGQGIDPDQPDHSKFDINKTTGEIFVLKVISFVEKYILSYIFINNAL